MSLITFAGGALSRATHLRAEAAALLGRADAAVLPLWRGKPLVSGAAATPCWLAPDDALLADCAEPAVFLGVDGDAPRFARDVSHLEGPAAQGGFLDTAVLTLPDGRRFEELRALMAAMDATQAGDAATAKGVLEWHRTHPRCARCGAPTAMEDGGWRRGCPDCGAKHFPRTDPVVIMLILHGDRALLGRQAAWPEGMYSLLAGFMEPGETVEDAVRRETMEEAGVPVGEVRYLCSQPWPFPSSLMLGCAGRALNDAISRDDAELQDAIWAERAEVAASLRGEPCRFKAARPGAVARAILQAWTEGRLDGALDRPGVFEVG
jgi:NAD+ diphosphatase